jgi:epoxyqueuosine reductase
MTVDLAKLRSLARECGFELCGATPAKPAADRRDFDAWVASGFAARMSYLTDRRQQIRHDPALLLPGAESVICVGKLYNGPQPYSADLTNPEQGWIARYAWGEDYHAVLQRGLEQLARRLGDHQYKICVDTAPLLERSYARLSGLGWIGKNTCLINQESGSWFFLGELLTTLRVEGSTDIAPDRCGTCTRCIDACPTAAIVQQDGRRHTIDSRLCISYLTIEMRGVYPAELRQATGKHIFGCDICQEVCPWNSRAPITVEFGSEHHAPNLAMLAALTPEEFQRHFRGTPVPHARYTGFLRNVAIAMGNAAQPGFRQPLEKLARDEREPVAEAAQWALSMLGAA